MSANGVKKHLGKELSILLKKKDGLIRKSAEILQIDFQSFRQNLYQSRFHKGELVKMCTHVGLPADTELLANEYEFTLKTQRRGLTRARNIFKDNALRANGELQQISISSISYFIELRQTQIAKIAGRAQDDEAMIFKALGEGDTVFVFITDSIPEYWFGLQSHVICSEIARALKAGMKICYLHPSEKLYVELSKCIRARFLTPSGIKDQFEGFKRYPMAEYVDESVIDSNMVCVEFDSPMLCTPHHQYTLYHHAPSDSESKTTVMAVETIPITSGRMLGDKTKQDTMFELSAEFTSFLFDFCFATIRDATQRAGSEGANECVRAIRHHLLSRM